MISRFCVPCMLYIPSDLSMSLSLLNRSRLSFQGGLGDFCGAPRLQHHHVTLRGQERNLSVLYLLICVFLRPLFNLSQHVRAPRREAVRASSTTTTTTTKLLPSKIMS